MSGLPLHITWRELKQILEPRDEIEHIQLMSSPVGDDTQTAIITLHKTTCEWFISNYNHTTIPGTDRKLLVYKYTEEPESVTKHSVRMSGLPLDVTWQDLTRLLQTRETITYVKMMKSKQLMTQIADIHVTSHAACEVLIQTFDNTQYPGCHEVLSMRNTSSVPALKPAILTIPNSPTWPSPQPAQSPSIQCEPTSSPALPADLSIMRPELASSVQIGLNLSQTSALTRLLQRFNEVKENQAKKSNQDYQKHAVMLPPEQKQLREAQQGVDQLKELLEVQAEHKAGWIEEEQQQTEQLKWLEMVKQATESQWSSPGEMTGPCEPDYKERIHPRKELENTLSNAPVQKQMARPSDQQRDFSASTHKGVYSNLSETALPSPFDRPLGQHSDFQMLPPQRLYPKDIDLRSQNPAVQTPLGLPPDLYKDSPAQSYERVFAESHYPQDKLRAGVTGKRPLPQQEADVRYESEGLHKQPKMTDPTVESLLQSFLSSLKSIGLEDVNAVPRLLYHMENIPVPVLRALVQLPEQLLDRFSHTSPMELEHMCMSEPHLHFLLKDVNFEFLIGLLRSTSTRVFLFLSHLRLENPGFLQSIRNVFSLM